MQKLNAGGDTSPGVIHSNIATRYDEIVTPWETCYQDAPGVTNTLLQDLCLLALNEHSMFITCYSDLQQQQKVLESHTTNFDASLSFYFRAPLSFHYRFQDRSAMGLEPA